MTRVCTVNSQSNDHDPSALVLPVLFFNTELLFNLCTKEQQSLLENVFLTAIRLFACFRPDTDQKVSDASTRTDRRS